MTQIPVAGLHAELALGTAKLSAGVAEANNKLGSLEGRMEGTSRRARKTGDDIDRGLSKGLKSAETSASTFGKRLDMLSNKFNPLFAASKRYEREVDLLNEALKRGVVGQSLYEQNLERLNAELASGAAGFGRAADQAQRFTGAASGMSFQTGNIAAQFQDIGVQLAGGQSPFLIALQQGTQLNGVFTQMGGSVRGVASGLGSALMSLVSPLSLITIGAIAAGGALVQWLMSSGEKAVTLDEALGNVSGAVGELQTITDLLSDTDLSGLKEQFGGLNAEIVEMLTLQRELALMDAMKGVSQVMSAAMGSMNGWITTQLDGIRAAFDTTYDNARQIQALMEDVQRASTPQEALDAVVRLRDYIEGTVGPLESLEGAAFEMARGLLEAESNLRQVVVQADRSETALKGAANEAARLAGSAPGAGWMSGAIGETNLLIGRRFRRGQPGP